MLSWSCRSASRVMMSGKRVESEVEKLRYSGSESPVTILQRMITKRLVPLAAVADETYIE